MKSPKPPHIVNLIASVDELFKRYMLPPLVQFCARLMVEPEDLITRTAAAQMWGKTVGTINNLINAGKLPAYGPRKLVSKHDIADLMYIEDQNRNHPNYRPKPARIKGSYKPSSLNRTDLPPHLK